MDVQARGEGHFADKRRSDKTRDLSATRLRQIFSYCLPRDFRAESSGSLRPGSSAEKSTGVAQLAGIVRTAATAPTTRSALSLLVRRQFHFARTLGHHPAGNFLAIRRGQHPGLSLGGG